MGRLFGTDGVRGVANATLTPELALGLGQAAAYYFRQAATKRPQRMIIGRDTRVSGEMLEAALAAGMASLGAEVVRVGVIPTPGVAYLCRALEAAAGVMISASHNPVADNGIKFFDQQGLKLSDAAEDELEAIYREQLTQLPRPTGTAVGRITEEPEARQVYQDHLVAAAPVSFQGLRIVLDCAFGAAFEMAPQVFERLGAEVLALHAINDGSRINLKCGSTHPGILQREVVAGGADLGLAFDGDADRVIAVDPAGRIVDGDQIITICGLELLRTGRLRHRKVAVTVYSNLGLIEAFKAHQAEVEITANGDRYVLEAMLRQDLVLGGEQSGHIIFRDYNSTGDGIMTALQLVSVLVQSGQDLGRLAAQMKRFPQVATGVRVQQKEGWQENPRINQAIEAATAELGANGRLLVRASGTEPVIRIMAEGPDETVLQRLVEQIAVVVRRELGA